MLNSQCSVLNASWRQSLLRIVHCAFYILLTACASSPPLPPTQSPIPNLPSPTPPPLSNATPLPTRAIIAPGQPLSYTVQTGDTVQALAAHFNTTVEEILAANPQLPLTTTLTPAESLTLPAYFFPLGGPTFKIIPDSEFVYGPANKDFDVAQYLQSTTGYLRALTAYANEQTRTSAQTIQYVAEQYSINPKLFLALMEWRSGALTQASVPPEVVDNPYGLNGGPRGFYLQSLWAAEQLGAGYYGWRAGTLTSIQFPDTRRSRVDMYQNAGTVGVQYLLAQMFSLDDFDVAAGPAGFAATYSALWGSPFSATPPDVLVGGLTQPELALPFPKNQQWSLTGGPHPGWGSGGLNPWAALDLAPPLGETGCIGTEKFVTASAPGVVVRTNDSTVILDLDGDGYEQTGWVIFYFHMARSEIIVAGTKVNTGDPLGHPSCEGGQATGTHTHLARKYNGEWLPANGIVDGVLPFVIGGWTAEKGDAPYKGRLVRVGAWVEACTCSTAANKVYWVR